MNIRLTRPLSILFLLTSIPFSISAEATKTPLSNTITFLEQQLEISIEIASNKEQREQGLMYRTNIAEDRGMLFVYPDQAPRHVWMKNTLIPLDVLFLATDGRIVSMLDNLQPCKSDPCPIYDSRVAATYMLELNAGFIKHKNLQTGQQLRLP